MLRIEEINDLGQQFSKSSSDRRKSSTTSLSAEQNRPLAEDRVILPNLSWHTFESLLADVGDRRKTLFHYLNGTLEIMSPLSLHEGSNRFIDDLIRAFSREFRKWVRANVVRL